MRRFPFRVVSAALAATMLFLLGMPVSNVGAYTPPDQWIEANITPGQPDFVNGYGWAVGSELLLQIDKDGDAVVDYMESQTVTGGTTSFNLGVDGYILTGSVVVVSGDSITRELVIPEVRVEYAEPVSDEAGGVAPPGVEVALTVSVSDSGPQPTVYMITPETGIWYNDLTGIADMVADRDITASARDDDGDFTTSSATIKTPVVNGQVDSYGGAIAGVNYWPTGTPVTITIDKDVDGTPEAVITQAVQFFGTPFPFDMSINPLPVGTRITATGRSGGVKDLILADMHVWWTDAEADLVAGNGPPWSTIEVSADTGPGPWPTITTTTDGAGQWFADFSGYPLDLTDGQYVLAQLADADGDRTGHSATVALPTVSAQVDDGPWVSTFGWPNATPVTVEVDTNDDGTPEASMTQPSSFFGTFFAFDFSVSPYPAGTRITAYGPIGDVKELLLAPLRVEYVGYADDVVAGVSAPDALVVVTFAMPGPQPTMYVTADGAGRWTVDWAGFYDIQLGDTVQVTVADADGDTTGKGATAGNLSVSANVYDGSWVTVAGWPDGTPVTVTLDTDGDGTPEATLTEPVQYWGHGFSFDPWLAPFLPGAKITATGNSGGYKELTLVDVHVDYTNPDTDEVAGIAPPFSPVGVDIGSFYGGPAGHIDTTADADGHWAVDFTGVYDFTIGMSAGAAVLDGDGDGTLHNTVTAVAYIAAGAGGNYVNVYGWPSGTPLRIQVDYTNDGSFDFDGALEANVWGAQLFTSEAFQAGARILVTGRSGPPKELIVSPLAVTAIDPAADTVSGTAAPGDDVVVLLQAGGAQPEVHATADGSGAWTADMGAAGVDVPGGYSVQAWVVDADGDQSFITWQAPIVFDITPDTDLLDGQSVTLSGSGWPAGETVYVTHCPLSAPPTESSCDTTTTQTFTVDANGVLSGTYVVHQAAVDVGLYAVTWYANDPWTWPTAESMPWENPLSFYVVTTPTEPSELVDDVEALDLPRRNEQALLKSLYAAQDAFDDGAAKTGCKAMTTFVKQVDDVLKKHLVTADEAAALIAAANAVKAAQGC